MRDVRAVEKNNIFNFIFISNQDSFSSTSIPAAPSAPIKGQDIQKLKWDDIYSFSDNFAIEMSRAFYMSYNLDIT